MYFFRFKSRLSEMDNILDIKLHNDDSQAITNFILYNKLSVVNHIQFMIQIIRRHNLLELKIRTPLDP